MKISLNKIYVMSIVLVIFLGYLLVTIFLIRAELPLFTCLGELTCLSFVVGL